MFFVGYRVDIVEQFERQARISDSKGVSFENNNNHNTTAGNEEDEASPPNPPLSPQATFQQMGLDSTDLSIVLGTAERLLPSVTEFVRDRLGVE